MKQADVLKTSRPHRSDIDGLRAVAVLMVLGNHLDFPKMSGGFVGVDIFFVISGYLITGIIQRDITLGRFSISTFYERRIRRIFPALLGMLVASTAAVLIVFPPQQLIAYGYSLISALLSYANLYYATKSGYFSPSYTKVLQHTWSLGVEEQFYLALPLILMLFARWSRSSLRWFIGVAWIASFAWACFSVTKSPTSAFYMPFTRAWELLSGSALALNMVPRISRQWMREGLGLLSLLALFGCMARFNSGTLFPGAMALPAVVASVLLIHIGESGAPLVTRWLTWKPVVFIGLISYSLYLWHWPILVVLNLGLIPGVDLHLVAQQLAVALICIVVGTASWWFVEQPFRVGRWKSLSRKEVFAWGGCSSLVFVAIAVFFIGSHGLPGRFPSQAAEVGRYLDLPQEMNSGVCFYESPRDPIQSNRCLTPDAKKKNVLLIGDSHAAMFWNALEKDDPTIHVMQINGAGCYPTFGVYNRSNCGRINRYLFEQYLPTAQPDAVILSARWNSTADFTFVDPLLKIFAEKHVPVYVIGPAPEFTGPVPLLLAMGLRWSNPEFMQSRQLKKSAQLDEYAQSQMAGRTGVTYLSLYKQMCPNTVCTPYANEAHTIPMMIDDNHLSNAGASDLVRFWMGTKQLPY